MSDFSAQYAADGSITAGPIEGSTWSGITPDSRFWPIVMEWEAEGNTINPYVPETPSLRPLTARQLRLGLVTHGIMLDRVEVAIAAIPDPQARSVAQIEWEYASQFEREYPLLAQIGQALGLSEAQIDDMWSVALEL